MGWQTERNNSARKACLSLGFHFSECMEDWFELSVPDQPREPPYFRTFSLEDALETARVLNERFQEPSQRHAALKEIQRKREAAKAATRGAWVTRRVRLPEQVAVIYGAVEELQARYPGRKFTPDGHLVGSLGEVVAAEELGLTLLRASSPAHDAYDGSDHVQIKMTARNAISLNADCDRLVVLKVVSPQEAEIVYDGPGAPAWAAAKPMKNGQRVVSLAKLRGFLSAR